MKIKAHVIGLVLGTITLTAAIFVAGAVLGALFIIKATPLGQSLTGSDIETKKLHFYTMARDQYVKGHYDDCLFELSMLGRYGEGNYANSEELESFCRKGVELFGPRKPSSFDGAISAADSDTDFFKKFCDGGVYQRFEKIYATPAIPKAVSVSGNAMDMSTAAMVLSHSLHAEYEAKANAAGEMASEIQRFCQTFRPQ